MIAIWREIMSGTLALEHPMRICHFGRDGSLQQAATLKFGQSVAYHGVEAIPTVFDGRTRPRRLWHRTDRKFHRRRYH